MTTTLVHSAVAADAERLRELAGRANTLSRLILDGRDAASRAEHQTLVARINDWHRENLAEVRADLVEVPGELLSEFRRAFEEMLPFAELYDEELAPPHRTSVRDDLASPIPTVMPRYHVEKLTESTTRFRQLVELEGPHAVLANETAIASNCLDWSSEFQPWDVDFSPELLFDATFYFGIEACAVTRDDLGVGEEVVAMVGAQPGDQLYDELAPPTDNHMHSWHDHGALPTGRFGHPTAFSSWFEDTTPLYWAADEDLHRLADRAATVTNWGDALARVAANGHGVLSWVQLMPPEAEGQRLFLVD